MVHLIFTIQINTPPPIEALLRTYTNKATGTYCIFFIMYPFSKTHLKFIVPHLSIIKRKVLLRHCIFRHRTYPQFLFPFFPDDLICILAGLTDIPLHRFFLIVLLTRPWGLLVACALGGSVLTIPVWAMLLLGAAGVAVFAVCLKYGDRWEAALLERFKR